MKKFEVQLWFNGDKESQVKLTLEALSPGQAQQVALRGHTFEVNVGTTPGVTDYVPRDRLSWVRVTEVRVEENGVSK